jgi:apolipoprotein N-acyltransferase
MLNQSDLSWYGQTTMKNDFFQFSQARALENQKYFLQDGNTGDTAFIVNP